MFTGFVLGVGFASLLYYIHKVGLPKVLQEMQQARIEMVAAVRAHASHTAPIPPARPNPVPLPSEARTPVATPTAADMVRARVASEQQSPKE